MPLYDFRCRTCDETFEVRRPMAEADAPVMCSSGHAETVKLLAFAAVGGRATDTGAGAGPAPMRGGGGCCGGACGC
ncbi:MAG TPA: zinc ribbon domain-containing protein [Acidimicrobiales bacterium]|nr:zinc ribbon domain-containing protein [Acidimicrobiales bacterium]